MFEQHHKKILNQLKSEWRELEFRLKACEQITTRVSYASINELRYAGRRIVAVLANILDNDKERMERNLNQAHSYFHNAQHDLTDALVNYYNSELAYMEKRYGPATLHDEEVYTELLGTMNKAMPDIRLSRKHMQGPRFEIYNRLVSYADELVNKHPDFKNMYLRLDRRRRERLLVSSFGIIMTTLGTVLTAIGLWLTIF